MQRNPSCPKCNSFFIARDTGRQNRQPLLLRCGHTYCEGCLKSLAKETKKFIKCPTCQSDTLLDGEDGCIKGLWPDMYISGLIMCNQKALLEQELSKIIPAGMTLPMMKRHGISSENKDKICRECCSKLASCKCLKCDCIMCSNCFEKVHSMSNTLKQHEATRLIEQAPDNIMSPLCNAHDGRLIEYFCEDDNTPICSRCVIVGEHKGHSITSMEDKNKLVFSDMEPALHIASQVMKKLKRVEMSLSKHVPDMKTETSFVIEEIRQHFQMLHGSLQARERDLIEEVYEAYRNGIEPLNKMQNITQDEIKNLDMSVKAAHRVLNNNGEVILNARDILDQLTRAKEVPCIAVPRIPSDTEKIIFSSGNNLVGAVNIYGNISGTVGQRVSLHTLNEMPEELINDDSDMLSIEDGGGDAHSIVSASETSTAEDVVIEDEQEIILIEEQEREVSDTKSKAKNGRKVPPKAMIKGHSEHVFVTHIKNPCQFMVQRQADSRKLNTLSRSINNWCNSAIADKHRPRKIEKGDMLLAKYTCDDRWYRARVRNVIGSNINSSNFKIDVLYIDYGNMEITTIGRVRNMQATFLRSGEFLIECGLYDITPHDKDGNWSKEGIQSFMKMTEGKPMWMTVVGEVNNVLQVDLSKPPNDDIVDDRPVSVRDSLVFLELANFVSPESSNISGGLMKVKGRSYMKPQPCSEGDQLNIVVTHVNDPYHFYVRESSEEVQYFTAMMSQMQETYSNELGDLWTVYCPYEGMICVSQFSADGLWYRVEVIGLPGGRQVDVQYVDFGNVERVPYFRLRKILDPFVMLPIQVIHCRLAEVEPIKEKSWTKQAKRWMSEIATMKHMKMQMSGQVAGTVCVVLHELLSHEPCSINGQLVGAGFALSTGKLSADVPPDSFRQPMISLKMAGESTSNKLQRSSSHSKSAFPQKSTTPPKAVSPNKRQSSRGENVKFNSDGRALKLDIEKATLSASKHDGSPKKDDMPSSPAIIEVKISHFVSPTYFHVQLATSGCEGLDKMMSELFEKYENTEHQWISWQPGSFCAVKYTEDNRWYRAKITKVLGKNQIEVFMVDFGYVCSLEASALRPLCQPYLKPMSFAFCCHLANLVPAGDGHNWSRTACEFMLDDINKKNMYIVKKGDTEENSLPVDLLLEEEIAESALEPPKKNFYSLIDKMVEHGLGIPIRRKPAMKSENVEMYEKPEVPESTVMHYKPMVPPVEMRLKVVPIYIDFEAVIYVQELKDDDAFIVMTDKLQDKFGMSEMPAPSVEWQVGQSCVGFFATDQMWYRAKVVAVEPARIKVQYLDYGNSEWVGTDKLRSDIAEFLDIPQQCLSCVLSKVKPLSEDGKWSVTVLDHIHKLLVNHTCAIDILSQEGEHLEVKLTLPDKQDLALYLSKLGQAEIEDSLLLVEDYSQKIYKIYDNKNPFKKLELETGGHFSVVITHVELPDVIYFQHAKQEGDDIDEQIYKISNQLRKLEMLAAKLNDIGPTAPVLPHPREGLACCAQFGYDNCWYRAVIVDIDQKTGQILVLYVDYGTSEVITLDRIRSLAPMHMNLPAQAVRARLHGVQPETGAGTSWTKNSLQAMIGVLGNKQLLVNITSQDPVTVDLFEIAEGEDNHKLAYRCLVEQGVITLPEKTQVFPEDKLGSYVINTIGIQTWAKQVEESELHGADNDDVIIEEITFEENLDVVENFEDGVSSENEPVIKVNKQNKNEAPQSEIEELNRTLENEDFFTAVAEVD